jgi:antitoxin VapB
MREAPISATAIFDALISMPTDFMDDGREDTPPQDRDSL